MRGGSATLRDDAGLAVATGVPAERVIFAEDGVVVDPLDGCVYVDGSSVGDVTESSLKDRRILGEEGPSR